jgi:hypothetical protein
VTTLVPATLTPLKNKPATKGASADFQDAGAPLPVQFNPTSLKLSRTNNIDKGGATTGMPKRQVPSVQSATLSFDLEFDTAEGKKDGTPQDVRDLTRIVRQFTEPADEHPKQPPPAVRFAWGTFRFQGIVTQLTEDLDYFSPTGMPLRAKVSVTITEVNPKWDAGQVGAGAKDARAAKHPDKQHNLIGPGGAAAPSAVPGNGPGSSPSTNPLSTALAKAGESVQQLLTRLDQDPAAWRSAMTGLDSPLGLAAGTQVQLGATASAGFSASARAGIGTSGGFTASAGIADTATTRAALGLTGGTDLGRGATAQAAAGFVLAEGGGVARASARVDVAAAGAAEASARASFEVPVPGTALHTRSGQASATVTTEADPRSLTFGRGIPLRARASGDAAATPGG